MFDRRAFDGDCEFGHRSRRRYEVILAKLGYSEGYGFEEGFGLDVCGMGDGIGIGEGDAAAGEHCGIINRLSLFVPPAPLG